MNYSQFIEAIKQMGINFPIPNLGLRSHFYITIWDNDIVVTNSKGNYHRFNEAEYNTVRDRFCRAKPEARFHAWYYARPNKNTPHRGWGQGNPNAIFSGYLPAVFRELYFRTGKSVCKCNCVWSGINYEPIDGDLFIKYVNYDEVEKLKEAKIFNEKINKQDFESVKNAIKNPKNPVKSSLYEKTKKAIGTLKDIFFGGIHINVSVGDVIINGKKN